METRELKIRRWRNISHSLLKGCKRISPCLPLSFPLRLYSSHSFKARERKRERERERERERGIERFGGAVERRCSLARSFAVTRQTLIEANWTPRGSRRSIKFPLDDPFHPYRAFSASLTRIRLCGYSIERRYDFVTGVTIGCLRFTRRTIYQRAIEEQRQSVSPWACQNLSLRHFHCRQLIINSVVKENLYEWRTGVLRVSTVWSKKRD